MRFKKFYGQHPMKYMCDVTPVSVREPASSHAPLRETGFFSKSMVHRSTRNDQFTRGKQTFQDLYNPYTVEKQVSTLTNANLELSKQLEKL